MGQSPPSAYYNSSGEGLPFYQGKADFGDKYPQSRIYCSQPARIAEPEDILISVRAPVGPTNVARERSCIGRGIGALRPRDELSASFLWFYLRYREPDIALLGNGSTFKAIGRDDLESLRVPFPPLPEQQRIARILEQADRLRRLRRYALALSDTFLPAAFRQMFGDPQGRGGNWERAEIGDLGLVTTGNTPSRANPEFYGADVEWIKTDNLVVGLLHPTKAAEALSQKGTAVGRTVNSGAVLMTCIAGSRASIGTVALADRKVAFNQQINAISPKAGIDGLFLYGLMVTAKPLLERSTTSAMQHMITKSRLEEIALIKPPQSLQQRFAALVERHERLRATQREALRQADHLFQSLLQRAFTGGV